MIKKTFGALLLLPAILLGHGNKTDSHVSHHVGATTLEYRAQNWQGESALPLALGLLSTSDWTAVLDKSLQSPGGKHEHYYLYKDGRQLSFQALSIHYYNNGLLYIQYPDLPAHTQAFGALSVDTTALRAELNCDRMESLSAYLSVDGALVPGFDLDFYGAEGAHYQAFVAGSEIFGLEDNRRYANDSAVSGYVYLPDPLSTANVNYGGNYTDINDGTNASLNAQRVLRNFTATYDNGVFKLENADIKIDEFSSPIVNPITSTSPFFNYTRDNDAFEDVNAFYHLSEFKKYIDSLGFSSIPGAQIGIDVHALSDADQSYYSPAEKRIYMGEGGVDDAEDADVVIHEYGHTLVNAASSNTNRISERAGMEEAICDYFAVSWSLVFSPNQRDRVFNWDGHNAFWPGRMASSTKDYQTLTFTSNIYAHTDLMASCLLEIRDNTSRQIGDAVVLEAIFSLQSNSSYADFARMVLQADAVLYGGANYQVIKAAFVRRNVLPADFSLEEGLVANSIKVYNTYGFLKGEALTIESEANLSGYTLMDLQGRLIQSGSLTGTKTDLKLEVPSGLYFLQINDEEGNTKSLKIKR